MIAVGIDPGKNTGFAVWNCISQEWLELETYDFWTAYHEGVGWWARARMEDRKMVAYIEDPNGNKPVFNRGQSGRKNLKIAQNVGMNKKEAELLISGFRRAGIVVMPITPKQQKWDADTFRQYTGYEGSTNEHVRDAGRMVFKLPPMADGQYNMMRDKLTE